VGGRVRVRPRGPDGRSRAHRAPGPGAHLTSPGGDRAGGTGWGHEERAVSGPTRGFTGRRGTSPGPRLPPGQYDAGSDWPVLHAEPTPTIDTATWTFIVDGLVERPSTWTWEEIRALPR